MATEISKVVIYVHRTKMGIRVQMRMKDCLGSSAFSRGVGVSGRLGLGNHFVVLHRSLSALGLWFLGFACTVCPFQERVKFGRVGVIESRERGLPWWLSGKKKILLPMKETRV